MFRERAPCAPDFFNSAIAFYDGHLHVYMIFAPEWGASLWACSENEYVLFFALNQNINY